MIKYFIKYDNFLKRSKLNRSLLSNLYFVRKKGQSYFVVPVTDCMEKKSIDLDSINNMLKNSKALSLVVELDQNEIEKYLSIDIIKFECICGNEYKKIKAKGLFSLINYRGLIDLSSSEINKGEIVFAVPCKKNKDYFSLKRDVLSLNKSIKEKRINLQKQGGLGNDIYFLTDDEELLDKFKDDIATMEIVDENMYKLLSHKLFVIDSIPVDDISYLKSDSYRVLSEIGINSTSVGIDECDGKYNLDSVNVENHPKKGYIINNDHNIMYRSGMEQLIKYINVYELIDGKYYKKIPFDEYKKEVMKYIKKPS